MFEANGPTLWRNIRRGIEKTLERFWRAGGLDGQSPSDAYLVRCDLSTMNQNDLDNGRVKVEITVRPTHSIERITVVLALSGGGETMLASQGVA